MRLLIDALNPSPFRNGTPDRSEPSPATQAAPLTQTNIHVSSPDAWQFGPRDTPRQPGLFVERVEVLYESCELVQIVVVE